MNALDLNISQVSLDAVNKTVELLGQASSSVFKLVSQFKERRYIDLSHPLTNATLHWPTNKGFNGTVIDKQIEEEINGTKQFVQSDSFATAIHSGTHLDAPRHFNKEGWTVDQIPLESLIQVPVTVIDLSAKVAQDRSYSFTKQDFINPTTNQSLVAPKSVVLVYTGVSQHYDENDKAKYFGTAGTNMTEMKIPGFGEDAAHYLATEVKVLGVGLDSASADSSARHLDHNKGDLIAHRIFCKNQIYILENVSKKLKDLVDLKSETGWVLSLVPLPLVGASGSPVRLVAYEPLVMTIASNPLTSLPINGSEQSSISYLIIGTVLVATLLTLTQQTLSQRDTIRIQ